ncbi:MAG: oxygen-independent coproporphyrinogen III oxidase [Clostridiales bacterium]|nr:oxygen-independent coproporphyrinogen III oxidase [Clostridiales bacterium]
MMKTNKLGLYIHIPFCIKKCRYCDFLSFSYSDKDLIWAYVNTLVSEIRRQSKEYDYRVDSIFIGGGTPTLVDAEHIWKILDGIYRSFQVESNVEITIESNPKTLSKEKLKAYHGMNINRLSMGVQSLNDGLLDLLGRTHSAKDFYNNYEDARIIGFDNINLDLIFSIPGQTVSIWVETLNKVLELNPEHISFYSLQLEEDTQFYKMYEEGKFNLIDDETDRFMYHKALSLMKEKGYIHYEISNVARPGYECRHNLKYWSMENYLGLGLGAHSYINGYRFANLGDIKEYIDGTEKVDWFHRNSEKDDITEYIITGLRKIEGISLKDFERRYRANLCDLYKESIDKHRKDGLLEIDTNGSLKLTMLGIDIANKVLVDFV